VKPAVFLDRDGTVIEDIPYLADPSRVKLLPGAADAICKLRDAGYVCVIITNQSGIGRGMLTEATLHAVHDEMCRQLSACGAALDGWYFCPVAPKQSDRKTVEHPDRKPGPGMLLRAARELDLDLSRSWMIGDMLSDMHAGRNANVRGTILVKTGSGAKVDAGGAAIDHVVSDLGEAVRLVLEKTRK
jgi:D-glycero-D-manno-heptose 1,7-bisphosphate phosphatase